MAVDVSNSVYQNTLYCAYFEVDGQANTYNIVVRKKLPTDNFFTQISAIVSGNTFRDVQFSGIDVDNLGQVHVSFFGSPDSVNYSLYHSVSTDGGTTFSTPNIISNTQCYNFCPALSGQTIPGINLQRVYPCAYIAADKTTGTFSSGNLYAAWTAAGINSPLSNGSDIYYSRSTDHGATWSSAVQLNSNAAGDSTHQYYPCINVSPTGTVAVCWYDRRNYTNQNTDYYMAYSVDGGLTFGNDFSVTSALTDFSTVGSQNQNFGIGEYNQVVQTPHSAIPFWTDGRTNDGNLNIYCAIVRLDSVASSVISIGGVANDFSLDFPYPNPAKNYVSIVACSKSAEKISIDIFDATGKKVKEIFSGNFFGDRKFDVNLSGLSNANYSVVMKNTSLIAEKQLSIQR